MKKKVYFRKYTGTNVYLTKGNHSSKTAILTTL